MTKEDFFKLRKGDWIKTAESTIPRKVMSTLLKARGAFNHDCQMISLKRISPSRYKGLTVTYSYNDCKTFELWLEASKTK